MEKVEFGNVSFDPFEPRFMCCCGFIHVKKGTKIIGIISLILTILSIVAHPGDFRELRIKISIVIFLILLLGGVKKENHRYLLPYLTLEGIAFVYCCFMVFIMIVMLLNLGDEKVRQFIDDYMEDSSMGLGRKNIDDSILLGFLAACFAFVGIIFGWWFSITYRCHNYFIELAEARKPDVSNVKY